MKNFLDKIFFRSNNLDHVSQKIKDLTIKTPANRIFEAINAYSPESEIRYVGGCIRKIINKEKVDDIDLATNIEPKNICEALYKNKIDFYESGKEHGTITAMIDEYKFEITTLREDIFTDGRHAKVKFSKDWKKDASRRDLTINSIYSDKNGNLFDPYEGKKDLEDGFINFIGDVDTRIKEDYLRILRYLRFFLNYSKQEHNSEIIRILKINIEGISKLSKERLIDELQKIVKLPILKKLSKDKLSLELFLLIFPELKNVKIFSKFNSHNIDLLKENDFIFLLSLLVIDDNDNLDYFLYKFNISKQNQKRMKIIDNFYNEKITVKTFTEKNMNKVLYYHGKQAVLDIIHFRIVKSKKIERTLIDLSQTYQRKTIPSMPISAAFLMKKYNIPEGKQLGEKLKTIEQIWVKNDFKISDQQVDNIIDN